jgi:signal transduction histidine kinase
MTAKIWPRSLMGQMLLAVAVALLLVQGLGAMLVYRAQAERREAGLLHTAAFRLLAATRDPDEMLPRQFGRGPGGGGRGGFRLEHSAASPQRSGEWQDRDAEAELREILAQQDMATQDIVVLHRDIAADPMASRRAARDAAIFGNHHAPRPSKVLVAGVRQTGGQQWLVARVLIPPGEREFVMTLIAQTLLLYGVLVGAIALILRRITRPLAALTDRLERFAETRSLDGQLEPQGPDDMRRLIVAHNAMEARIAALLDEKDVMLGAIGHDLKTPLAALRVRIESVEDDTERGRMAATIEDIVRSLDDILSLARVGRPSDPLEKSEISALVASVVEEYEDMDEPVELADMQRIVMPIRSTWLRRGLRNLIDNALRYGQRARVSLVRESRQAVIWVEDDGPGIAEAEIERMMEPFSRGEPSRNSATGGAGLGLTLARAIAEQHGGALQIANRRGPDGKIIGLVATLSLPLS